MAAKPTTEILHYEDNKFRYTLREMKNSRGLYLLMAPFFILFAIFTFVPVVMSLPMGFTNFNMVQLPQWVPVGMADQRNARSAENHLYIRILCSYPCG